MNTSLKYLPKFVEPEVPLLPLPAPGIDGLGVSEIMNQDEVVII